MERLPVEGCTIHFIPRGANHWTDLEGKELDHAALTRAECYVHDVLCTNSGTAVKLEGCYGGYLIYMVGMRPGELRGE